MNPDVSHPRYWKNLYVRVSICGTAVTVIMGLALIFGTELVATRFNLQGDTVTWTQLCGVLLTLIGISYALTIFNVDRFRPYAWIGAIIVRGPIFLLCILGVLYTGAPSAFLVWALIELVIACLQVFLLNRLERTEHVWQSLPRGEEAGMLRNWELESQPKSVALQAGCWKKTYLWVGWIGIVANLSFAVPLALAPHWMLALLGVSANPVIWAQMAGMLLSLLFVLHIPATVNPDRYWLLARALILTSFVAIILFCVAAVVGLKANDVFLLLFALELPFAILQAIILSRLRAAKQLAQRDLNYSAFRNWWVPATVLATILLLLGTLGWHKLMRPYPQQLANDSIEEYFMHGSVGTEDANGLPYWIWITLPVVFPEYLPKPGGYSALGFLWEPGTEMPIGFSRKRIGFDRVGINCAMCHAGSAQIPSEPRPRYYLGAPAITANILGYQRFLFACANDPRFTPETLMPAIARQTRLSGVDKLLYRLALIPATRKALREQSRLWEWTYEKDRPEWGPGRIEPFNPVKVSILNRVDPNVKVGSTLGTSDMEPLWNLGALPGRAFHWDGLNTDLREVVDSSALGDGATIKSIPRDHLRKLEAWIKTNAPPKFPFADKINTTLLKRGEEVYRSECARCHAPGGQDTGKVLPTSGEGCIDTDNNRAHMWTPESAAAYNAYLGNLSWRFTHFRSTTGYVNVRLDGLWLRAPYLHNGSIPYLTDLLKPASQRPAVFWRGLNTYDPARVGYLSEGAQAEATGFKYDTSGRGNSNQGHEFGTRLSAPDKTALLEYLKTL